jgi:hypothetical protein
MLRSSVIVLAASLLIAAVSAAAPANVPKAAPKMGAGKVVTPATTKVAKQQPAQSKFQVVPGAMAIELSMYHLCSRAYMLSPCRACSIDHIACVAWLIAPSFVHCR